MNKTIEIGMRLGVLGAAALLCTGCPNPQTYGTPRTTPAGKIQHNVAAEGIGYSSDLGGGALPTPPSYTLRIGVADSVDIGARLANLTSLGADVKWNFLRSESFDMAIDPSFQFFRFSASSTDSNGMLTDASLSVLYLNAPLMFGINLGESVTIVPTAGITWGWASSEVDSNDAQDAATGSTGIMLRPGIGFNFRISPRFALHPEITFLKPLEDNSGILYTFGLGFNFGNLPKFGGGGEAAAEEK